MAHVWVTLEANILGSMRGRRSNNLYPRYYVTIDHCMSFLLVLEVSAPASVLGCASASENGEVNVDERSSSLLLFPGVTRSQLVSPLLLLCNQHEKPVAV